MKHLISVLPMCFALLLPNSLSANPDLINELTFPPVPVPAQPVQSLRSPSSNYETHSFTDSQGRTTLYRYSIPANMDTSKPQPVLIEFHGNNSGTQKQLLDMFFWIIERKAHARGLVAVMVTSPDTKQGTDDGTRHWDYDVDRLLIHEFLQEKLPKHVNVDFNRIYFSGGSQGTCFLNVFLPKYGKFYKGGFYAGCGCHNYTKPTWSPKKDFVDNMKVYVESTKDDFLYETSKKGYAYYKYTIGFDTRGDLDSAGKHCSKTWNKMDIALDWFTGRKSLPEEPFKPHFKRISADASVDVALADNGTLTKSVYDGNTQSTISISSDKGRSWREQSTQNGNIERVLNIDNTLYAIFKNTISTLKRSPNNGKSFVAVQDLEKRNIYKAGLSDNTLYLSTNYGASRFVKNKRTDFSDGRGKYPVNEHAINGMNNAGFLFADNWSVSRAKQLFYAVSGMTKLDSIKLPQTGSVNSVTTDGKAFYSTVKSQSSKGYTMSLMRSIDNGGHWKNVSLPTDMNTHFRRRGSIPYVAALASDTLLIYGSWGFTPWLSQDGGKSWRMILGYDSWQARIVANKTSTYLVNPDGGVFRMILNKESTDNPPPNSDTFTINVIKPQSTRGRLTCNKKVAKKDDEIVCEATPEKGYEISRWTYACEHTNRRNNICRFKVSGNENVGVVLSPRTKGDHLFSDGFEAAN